MLGKVFLFPFKIRGAYYVDRNQTVDCEKCDDRLRPFKDKQKNKQF